MPDDPLTKRFGRRDGSKDGDSAGHGQRIKGRQSKNQFLHQTHCPQRDGDSCQCAAKEHESNIAHYQAKDGCRRRAQGHAHAKFAAPLRDSVADGAIQADHRQKQRQRAEES